MNRDHVRQIATALQEAALVLPSNRELTTEAIRVFAGDVEDLPVNEVVAAIREWRKSERFMPTPADIRERVEGSAEDRRLALAEQAWEGVRELVRTHSPNDPNATKAGIALLPPAAQVALRQAGGVASLADRGDDELERFVHRRFVESCMAAERNPYLYGIVEGRLEGKPSLAKLIHEAASQSAAEPGDRREAEASRLPRSTQSPASSPARKPPASMRPRPKLTQAEIDARNAEFLDAHRDAQTEAARDIQHERAEQIERELHQ